MAGMNRTHAAAGPDGCPCQPAPKCGTFTATLVRQIAKLGGDVTPFVPPHDGGTSRPAQRDDERAATRDDQEAARSGRTPSDGVATS